MDAVIAVNAVLCGTVLSGIAFLMGWGVRRQSHSDR
jgi:hypothetical protein